MFLDWRQRSGREEADEAFSRQWQKRPHPLPRPHCWFPLLWHWCECDQRKKPTFVQNLHVIVIWGDISITLSVIKYIFFIFSLIVFFLSVIFVLFPPQCFVYLFGFLSLANITWIFVFLSLEVWCLSWWRTGRQWTATAIQLVWGKCSLMLLALDWCSSITRTAASCSPLQTSVIFKSINIHLNKKAYKVPEYIVVKLYNKITNISPRWMSLCVTFCGSNRSSRHHHLYNTTLGFKSSNQDMIEVQSFSINLGA